MKVGQACTYVDDDKLEFSAKIERIAVQRIKEKDVPIVNVVYKQSGKERRAELVPEDRIINVHDFGEPIEESVDTPEEVETITESTDEDDIEDNDD